MTTNRKPTYILFWPNEFIQNFEGKTQTDVVVLDFSKPRPLTLSPINASYTNSTTMEFGEQLLIGFKISWPIEPKK